MLFWELEKSGAEDFAWEEPYVLGIFDQKDYEQLKKTRPAYTDKNELIEPVNRIDDLYGMMTRVRRISDNKVFEIPLWDLETVVPQDPNSGLLAAFLFVNKFS